VDRLNARSHDLPTPLAAALLGLMLAVAAAPAVAADPCAGFKWDVTAEHRLFMGSATALAAARSAAAPPMLAVARLYELTLNPQDQTTFALPPGKTMLADGAFAGVLLFKIDAPGAYRVSLDAPFWIDVIAGGKLVPTKDFQGQRDCKAPHKIVEYPLSEPGTYVLQLSGAAQASVRLTITPSPAPRT
jgi:hypothetical protein